MQGRRRALRSRLAFSLAAVLAGAARAQDFTIGPWNFVEPPRTSVGDVVQCERQGSVAGPTGQVIRLRAAASVRHPASDWSICDMPIEAASTVTVTGGYLSVRARARLHGTLADSTFNVANHVEVRIGSHVLGFTPWLQVPGRGEIVWEDSLIADIGPGTFTLGASLRAYVELEEADRPSAAASDFFSGADGGLEVEFDFSFVRYPPPCEPFPPENPKLGLFADADGSRCNIPATPATLGEFFVLATGDMRCGLAGAEFRIAGLPGDWFTIVEPGPAVSAVIGQPLQDGCNIGLSSCPTTSPVVLLRVRFLPMMQVGERLLDLRASALPSCQSFAAPNG